MATTLTAGQSATVGIAAGDTWSLSKAAANEGTFSVVTFSGRVADEGVFGNTTLSNKIYGPYFDIAGNPGTPIATILRLVCKIGTIAYTEIPAGGGGGGSINLGFRFATGASDAASSTDINGTISFSNGSPGPQSEDLSSISFTTKGQFVIIVDASKTSGANPITVTPPAGMTIDGGATDVLNSNGDSRWYVYDGVSNLESI